MENAVQLNEDTMSKEELDRRIDVITEAVTKNMVNDSQGNPVPGSAIQSQVLSEIPDNITEDVLDPEVDSLTKEELKKALGVTMLLLTDSILAEQEAAVLLKQMSGLMENVLSGTNSVKH